MADLKSYKLRMVTFIAVAMMGFHLYTGAFGLLESYLQRSIHLLFVFMLAYWAFPTKRQSRFSNLVDITFGIMAVLTIVYIFLNYGYFAEERFPFATTVTLVEKIFAFGFLFMLFEACRRQMGLILPIIALIFISYLFAGPYLPGILQHAGYSVDSLVDIAYLSTTGTFSLPLGVSSSYIVLFILFGSLMKASGLGDFLMNVAIGLAGRSPGGPAKIAVVSSGLMGMISGSPVANVVTTGSFTIPLMKRIGYAPHYAGAVEAVASTGGMIMPPIMGVLAFLLAEYTRIPYIQVCKYSFLVAAMYYFGIYCMVHFEARKIGLRGMSTEELPDVRKILKNKFLLIIPIVVLIGLLVLGYTAMFSVVYSILSIFVVTSFKKETRIGPAKLVAAFEDAAKASVMVALACAIGGLIGGTAGISGLALRLSNSLVIISGDQIVILLILIACVSLLLGMGLPGVVAYIVQVPIIVPALVQMGVPLFAAHLFIVYFATLSNITPPVGLALYAAIGIAQSNLMRTGINAVMIGSVAFILPFMFVFSPELLLMGDSVIAIILATITAIIGVFMLAVGLEGFWMSRLMIVERVMSITAALLLIKPGVITDLLGILLISGVGVRQLVVARKKDSKFSPEIVD